MTANCSECGTEFILTRKDKKLCGSINCKIKHDSKVKKRQQERDYCSICEFSAPTTRQVATHMKKVHNRLILEQDMNRAYELRQKKYRAIQAEEDALLGVEPKQEQVGF